MVPSSIATDLDIRNDNSGANVALTSTTLDSIFSYSNTAPFTATWNLATVGLNTTSYSYTARLFASTTQGDPLTGIQTGIQDQAGNDLDGINSGIGGQDATLHFGSSGYTAPTLTLTSWNSMSSSNVWNSSLPLVFAPSIPAITGDAGSILSLSTTTDGASTIIKFQNTAPNHGHSQHPELPHRLFWTHGVDRGPAGRLLRPRRLLGHRWRGQRHQRHRRGQHYHSLQSSSALSDGSYVPSPTTGGFMHISPEGGSEGNNTWAYVPEEELIQALKQITGSTINRLRIPYTASTTPSSRHLRG